MFFAPLFVPDAEIVIWGPPDAVLPRPVCWEPAADVGVVDAFDGEIGGLRRKDCEHVDVRPSKLAADTIDLHARKYGDVLPAKRSAGEFASELALHVICHAHDRVVLRQFIQELID